MAEMLVITDQILNNIATVLTPISNMSINTVVMSSARNLSLLLNMQPINVLVAGTE